VNTLRLRSAWTFVLTLAFTAFVAVLPVRTSAAADAAKTDPADPVEKSAPKPDKPAAPAGDDKIDVVHPNDATALKERMGKEVAVEGQVKEAAWSKSGKVMNVEFADAADSKFFVAAFVKAKPALDAAFGGDVAKTISGKRVRVTGVLKDFKGRPEIMLDKPEQLEVLPGEAAPAEAERK
jgi:hypothetical protein